MFSKFSLFPHTPQKNSIWSGMEKLCWFSAWNGLFKEDFRKIFPDFGELQLGAGRGGQGSSTAAQLRSRMGLWIQVPQQDKPTVPKQWFHFSDTIQTLLHGLVLLQFHNKIQSQESRAISSCWTFLRSLCLMTSQLQSLMKCGCDRWLLTRRWHQTLPS